MNISNSCQQANTTSTRRNDIGVIPPGTDQQLSELARLLNPPLQYSLGRISLQDVITEALAIVEDLEDEMDAKPKGNL
jgi:hypothetical protein